MKCVEVVFMQWIYKNLPWRMPILCWVNSDERELVELYAICPTKMEENVPSAAAVRLIAFNLCYLPGGDKKVITLSHTTLHALEAAKRILAPGGLISMVVYVGHDGRR